MKEQWFFLENVILLHKESPTVARVHTRKLNFKMSYKYKNLKSIINKIWKKVLFWLPSLTGMGIILDENLKNGHCEVPRTDIDL